MPNYPGSLDDDISLFLAVNNARTRLTSSINISDLTIPVVTTSGFPNQGFITILTNPDDITEAEAIAYTGVTETTFSGTQRGAGGTPIFAHGAGNNVDLTVMAEHHNELKDAIIELEKFVGVSGSENFVPKDAQGNVIISGTLGVQGDVTLDNLLEAGTLIVSGTSVFVNDVDMKEDLTVSGVARFGPPLPPSTLPPVYSQFIDGPLTFQFVPSNTEEVVMTAPGGSFSAGDYLILYMGNAGEDTNNNRIMTPSMSFLYNGVETGRGDGIPQNSTEEAHNLGGALAGFTVQTATPAHTAEIRINFGGGTGSVRIEYGTLGIVAVPLSDIGLVEDTDYFFDNGTDAIDTKTGSSWQTVTDFAFTVPDDGDYTIFFTTEVRGPGNGTANVRVVLDPPSSDFLMAAAETPDSRWQAYPIIVIRTLTSGNHTLRVEAQSEASRDVDTRRTRFFVLRNSSFDQVVGVRSEVDAATTSTTYQEITGLTQTFTPSTLDEQLLILSTFGYEPPNSNDTVSYKLTNATDAEDYRVDSGPIGGTNFTERSTFTPGMMMHLISAVDAAKEIQVQFRKAGPAPTSISTHKDGSLVLWGMSAPPASEDAIATTVNEAVITSHQIDSDIINSSQSLTVSGLAVHAGPDIALETLTADAVTAGTLTVTGTSCLDDVDVKGDLTVSGTSDLCSDVDVKGDLTVSGTAKFGQSEAVSSFGSIIFASQDTEQTATSNSLVNANCETTPLLDGVEYLVIYNGYAGNNFTTQRTTLQAQFGGTKIGGGIAQKSGLGTFGNNHFNGISTNGIFKVTGDGTSTVRFRYSGTGASIAYAGAMSIICIPLDQFTEGTDYYYVQNANNDTFDVINAPNADLPATSLLSSTFNGMASGDWLFIWSDEGVVGNGQARTIATRFQVDSVTVGPSRYGHHNDNGTGAEYTFTSAHIVNVPAGGNIPVEILVSSNVAPESDWRRGRIFAINTAAFNQVLSSTDSTGFTENSGAYQDFTGLNTTITPSQPDAPIIILTSATSYTQDDDSGVAAAIRNETDGIDYRDDSGKRNLVKGGLGAAGIDLDNLFMAHFEERTALTEYRVQLRSEGAGNVSIGRNDDDTGGELSEMILWEFTPTAPFIPITNTCIDDDQIQTGTLIADTITARLGLTVSGVPVTTGTHYVHPDPFNIGTLDVTTSLTISGVPVSTGTGGGGAGGDFVARAGDSMTGNLDMAGNNVYNAGVVAMQDNIPVLTTSGLLWFDTDAPGHGEHGSASLPGGFLGALVTTSSGISVEDSGGFVNLQWDTDQYDNGGWFDLSSSDKRLVVPSGVTFVQLVAGVRFAQDTSGDRRIVITRNNEVVNAQSQVATVIDQTDVGGTAPYVHTVTSPVLTASGGDFFVLNVRQTSGGPIEAGLADGNNDTFFSIRAVDTRGIPGVNSLNLLQGDVNIIPGSGLAVSANSQSGTIEIGLAAVVPVEGFEGALVAVSSGTTIANDSADSIAWDTISYDSNGFFSSALPTRFTIPTEVNKVRLSARLRWTQSTNGDRRIIMRKNGSSTLSVDPSDGQVVFEVAAHATEDVGVGTVQDAVSPIMEVIEGDYFQVFGRQGSGGDLDLLPETMWWQLEVLDPLRANITLVSGTFSESLTISGVPVSTGTGGGGAGNITDINAQAGPSITITGTAGIGVITVGNVITIDGTDVQGSGGGGSTISGCYTHIQSSASDTWNVTHNLASVPVNYIVLDNSNVEVIPDTFTVNDSDSVTITFVVPQAGTADIFPCISGTGSPVGETEGTATISGCYSHVQSVAAGTWTINHNLGTDVVNYVVLDNSGSQIQPDDFTIVDDNQVTLDFVSSRTGIANIFACVDGDVIFAGGIFSNLVAVTGTFTQGITVGEGTTFITGSGIDTPELKIAGETPNFGGGAPVSSGIYFLPQVKPAIIHDTSDWFDDNSGNPTLTGSHSIDTDRWTLWDVDTVANANTGKTAVSFGGDGTPYDMNIMQIAHDGSTINGWIGYHQPVPASASFTITARVGLRRSLFDGGGAFENSLGVFIAGDLDGSPSTADLVSMTIGWDGLAPTVNGWAIYAATEWSDYNSQGASTELSGNQVNESLWVRISYNSGTDQATFLHSEDGITWSELRRLTPLGFTPVKIGFGINSTKSFTSHGKVEFFAVFAGARSDDPLGHGRMVPVIPAGEN